MRNLGRVNFTRSTALLNSDILRFGKVQSFCTLKTSSTVDEKIENEMSTKAEQEVLFMNYKEPKLNEFIKVLVNSGKNKKRLNFAESVNSTDLKLTENILTWLENLETEEKKKFLSTLVGLNVW